MHKKWFIFGEINSYKGADTPARSAVGHALFSQLKKKPLNQLTQAIVHHYTFISYLNAIER